MIECIANCVTRPVVPVRRSVATSPVHNNVNISCDFPSRNLCVCGCLLAHIPQARFAPHARRRMRRRIRGRVHLHAHITYACKL